MEHEEIRNAFSDIYNKLYIPHKKNATDLLSDKDWEEIINKASEINKKYNTILVREIIHSVLGEFERKYSLNLR